MPNMRRRCVSDLYFKDTMIATDHVRHFASDVLGMVNILYVFLIDKIQPRGLLSADHIKCFEALYGIMCILRRGEMTTVYREDFMNLTMTHNRLFLELYGNKPAKIKFHHTYHLPDDMLRMGSCLSCFPTERKNKDALAVSTASDRHMARTATINFLHKTLAHWAGNEHGCLAHYLVSPKLLMLAGVEMQFALAATLPCGEVHKGDLVLFRDGDLGKVLGFWARKGDHQLVVQANIHRKLQMGRLAFECQSVLGPEFRIVEQIVECVIWYEGADRLIVGVPKYS